MKPLRRVRIECPDGNFFSARVTDAETGQEIHVTELSIGIDSEEGVTAVLWIPRPAVDLVVDAQTIEVCPQCQRPLEESGA